MYDTLAQGAGEIVGIAAVAGIAMAGAFKLATVVVAKRQNGNAPILVRTNELPCAAHAERLATIEANSLAAKEKLDTVAADVKQILFQTKGKL